MTAGTEVVEAEIILDEPGIYRMTEAAYHADPVTVPGGSLSCSGAKKLLPPSCPARYRHDQLNPPPPKDHLELGTAAHRLVLDAGMPICRLSHDDWRTKAAREARDQARAQGYVPVLESDYQRIAEMAAAIRAHPVASALLDPDHGEAEQNLFWVDEATGIWRRARLDWLPRLRPGRRMILADYKTCDKADPDSIRKATASYGYFMQDAWYRDAVTALGLDDDPAFLFVFQEKTPPYLVNVAELDPDAVAAGRARNTRACEIWRDCTETGLWPGYEAQADDGITYITLPPWATRAEDIA